ncbi:MAG: 16S rRNA (cytosine(1402)-N(4))-methyltransferase RsmH [Patescibacteria group bacterium]
MPHSPVLLRQTTHLLALDSGYQAIDCTVGEGGHAREMLKAIGSKGKLLALDADKENIARARVNLKEFANTVFVNSNFVHLKEIAAQQKFDSVKAILMDLGWSMSQFENSGRGFSFLRDEPLDMRLQISQISNLKSQNLTASEILNDWPEEDVGRVLREYGEEKRWKEIARAIIKYRKKQPFKTTLQLVEVVDQIQKNKNFRISPATQTFQALRIAVNDELNNLKKVLPQAIELLEKGGRLAIITFHSLEDRIVKQFFQNVNQQDKIKLITKKPVVADPEELEINPRVRSAKLRVIEKL